MAEQSTKSLRPKEKLLRQIAPPLAEQSAIWRSNRPPADRGPLEQAASDDLLLITIYPRGRVAVEEKERLEVSRGGKLKIAVIEMEDGATPS
jgi:hypothetical protein